MTEDEMVGWHHRLNGHEFEQALGDGKESFYNAGEPGSGGSPGGVHGNPLPYPCLENSMNREAWWATVHGVIKSQT